MTGRTWPTTTILAGDRVADVDIAVFNLDGEYSAIEDVCTNE